MTRRLPTLVLALTLVVPLAACGGADEPAEQVDVASADNTAADDTAADDAGDGDDDSTGEAEGPTEPGRLELGSPEHEFVEAMRNQPGEDFSALTDEQVLAMGETACTDLQPVFATNDRAAMGEAIAGLQETLGFAELATAISLSATAEILCPGSLYDAIPE